MRDGYTLIHVLSLLNIHIVMLSYVERTTVHNHFLIINHGDIAELTHIIPIFAICICVES